VLQCVANMLQCAAVCCSVLQYVAVCCSAMQYVAVFCSVLQCSAVCCSVLQCVAVCCSVLQCVVLFPNYLLTLWGLRVCCSMLQCVAVCCDVLQCNAVCRPLFQLSPDSVRLCVGGGSRVMDCFEKRLRHPPSLPPPLSLPPPSVCQFSAGKQGAGDVLVWHEDKVLRVLESVVECCRVLKSVAECSQCCRVPGCRVLQCMARGRSDANKRESCHVYGSSSAIVC